jgi:cytoskeletal protein CcmA (bactofilin family)
MDSIARIGSTIQIKGEVTSREPLVIAGKVEGTIDVEGHALTLDPGGRLDATIIAQTIVIAGAVKGSLTAEARIVVKETASIEGELSAPAISLAEGATVSGKIDTGDRKKPGLSLAS